VSDGVSFTLEGAGRAAANLDRYGRHISGMWRVYDRIAVAFRALERTWFRTRGEGSWPALDPVYAAWKAVHFPGKPMMVREGKLYDSLAKDGVLSQSPNEIVLGTDVDYGDGQRRAH
jgi:phage gpG-like protein